MSTTVERQIVAAVQLLFNGGDPLVVHLEFRGTTHETSC